MPVNRPPPFRYSRGVASGYSLVEVLVALVVVAIGLLALAGMQLTSLRNNTGSYLRSQAAVLAQDLADRILASHPACRVDSPLNPPPPCAVLADYRLAISQVPGNPGANCAAVNCNPQQMAQWDLFNWYTNARTALPGFNASVTCTPACALGSDSVYQITVMWDDDRTGVTGTGCSGTAADLVCYQLGLNP